MTALTANRMLVLVDGRVVYDPLINVTLWDTVDVVIEDIERIEVIRGPGPTLWGVNAMNGVVNVITRSASETTGLLAVAGGGDPQRAFGSLRYGRQLRGARDRQVLQARADAGLVDDAIAEVPLLDLHVRDERRLHELGIGLRLLLHLPDRPDLVPVPIPGGILQPAEERLVDSAVRLLHHRAILAPKSVLRLWV